ncbi:endo alpha-1,4 polygalactosaminidase [Nocardia heshunensis]
MTDRRGGFLRRLLVLVIGGTLSTVGCSTPGPDSVGVQGFPVGQVADYQLGGQYPPPPGTKIVVRDSTAEPAAGLYNICYVNGFQTQPGERELWLRDRRDLVLIGQNGSPLIDENWPDELILDTSTPAKRTRLAEIINRSVDTCATKGFNAVEFDNLDSYTRSQEALTVDDNIELAAALAKFAHAAGLAVGQKNAAELGERGRGRAAFDFAIAEECLRFQECGSYAEVYGQAVIDIEYVDDLPAPLGNVCSLPNRLPTMIIRDRKLVAQGATGYFYRAC